MEIKKSKQEPGKHRNPYGSYTQYVCNTYMLLLQNMKSCAGVYLAGSTSKHTFTVMTAYLIGQGDFMAK